MHADFISQPGARWDSKAPAVHTVQREAADERDLVHGADNRANGHMADAGPDLGGSILCQQAAVSLLLLSGVESVWL